MRRRQFLLLEDSALDAELIQATLQESDLEFDLTQVQSREQFTIALQTQRVDLILSDYSLPNFDGISALAIAQQICPQIPFIFVSATLGEELAIETLKSGATDYVLKQRLVRLVPAVQRALREAQERQERQRAETALQETEDQYRLLFEQSPFGVLLIRAADQSLVEFNAQACQQLEYSREEFAQLKLFQIEALEASTAMTYGQTATQQGFEQFETKQRTKSGQLRDVLVTVQSITIGGEQYLHAIWQDITERKQAEIALKERSERLRLLYEATSELLSTDQPLTLLDELFQNLSAHMGIHCYLNFLVKQVNGKSILSLTAYGGISEASAQSLRQLEAEQTLCGLAIAENHPVVLPHVQDSTQPRAALIQSLGVTAYAGYPLYARGRLLGALSFGSRSRTHFTREELDLLQATADQVAMALERASLLTSLQQQTEQLTQANRIKDEFLAVLSHELRTPLNPILGWVRLLRSRKYDEIATERALEIIERNAKIQTQLIEDLLDVSRILRGKLSLNVAPVNLVSTIEAALETVQLAAEAKAIELHFTKLETNLNQAANLRVNSALQVLGDANRLQQIVWNLLSNAVKFTPTGGRVDVRLERVELQNEARIEAKIENEKDSQQNQTGSNLPIPHSQISIHQTQSPAYAQITVTDTGNGIKLDFLPYVFDYFRQADGSTTRAFGGLGLGLAIVRHLVELHGGTVEAASAGEGQGATFTVTLPLMKTEPVQQKDKTLSRPSSHLVKPPELQNFHQLKDLKILVVDDEKDALDFITFLLEQSGAKVTTALTAGAALSALQQVKPDILISDIGMPGQDGYALLGQVRLLTKEQGGQVPAIALTAYARDEDSERALAAGFQKHLAKPIEPTVLIAAIAALVKR